MGENFKVPDLFLLSRVTAMDLQRKSPVQPVQRRIYSVNSDSRLTYLFIFTNKNSAAQCQWDGGVGIGAGWA
jgi:hypothetical protein